MFPFGRRYLAYSAMQQRLYGIFFSKEYDMKFILTRGNAWLEKQFANAGLNKTKAVPLARNRFVVLAILDRYATLTSFAFATAFFGNASSSTPFSYFAEAAASSTSCASEKLRETLP